MKVGFEVLTEVSMKIAVFWVVAPCRAMALMMEAARISETLVNFYQTTRCYNPEDSNLQLECKSEKHFHNLRDIGLVRSGVTYLVILLFMAFATDVLDALVFHPLINELCNTIIRHHRLVSSYRCLFHSY
jgi:hypothetical protein